MTDIDPASHALLLLDLQNEMVSPEGKVGGGGLAAVVESRSVLSNAAAALAAARRRGNRVVHVRLGFRPDYADCLSVAPRIAKLKEHKAAILGSWGTQWPDVVAPRDDEMIVTKTAVSPFFNTGLMHWLAHNGVRTLHLGGVATNLVVESTARAADDAGFKVFVLEDCCAAPNQQWHDFAMQNILPMFASISSSAAFAEMA